VIEPKADNIFYQGVLVPRQTPLVSDDPHRYDTILSRPAECPTYATLLTAIHKRATINLVRAARALFAKTRPEVSHATMTYAIATNGKESE
jgi:hypothetical protein